ncbi:MAG TPA: FkbM family methyltransferase [Nocardioides sp.]|jgi:FkbM family methyltransferase|nr:FkbM family methyltransferase [Nocardioides sp.]
MAGDLGSCSPAANADAYRYWAAYTAALAEQSGRPREAIDRRVLGFFRDLCRTVEPTVCLELGAHEARFSRWAKKSFPDARCLALEANPYVHAKFRERVEEAGVEYHHLAAAATSGTVTINIPTSVWDQPRDRDNRMASLSVHQGSGGNESVEVTSVRVDDLLTLTDDDRLVAWIDVEGASDQVLTGGREVLRRAAAVYIEVESVDLWPGQWLDADVAAYLHELGKVPAIRDVQRARQYNVVFLDAALAARPEVGARAARVLARRGRKAEPGTEPGAEPGGRLR